MARCSRILAYGLPAAAALALLAAIVPMAKTYRDEARIEPRFVPPLQPMRLSEGRGQPVDYIGAVGLAEPSSQEIHIGTDVSGTVDRVLVSPGARVAAGTPLFVIDSRIAEATLTQRDRDLAAAEARLAEAKARVPGLEADLDVARTAVQAARADRDEAADMARIADRLEPGAAITERELTRRKNVLRMADARLEEARAKVAHARAALALFSESGGGASIAVGRAVVEQAKAAVSLAQRDLELRTVRAPIDGTVLQVNVRPGEYAQAGGSGQPLIVMGALDPLYLRVDVDEADIPRWRPGAPATASVRGDAQHPMRLVFVRQEPLVVPKRALSGLGTERVDTRVMQVIYQIETAGASVLPGQQLDVFIEASGIELQAHAAQDSPQP